MKTNKKTDRKLIKQLISLVDYLLSKAEDYDEFRTDLVYEIYKLIMRRELHKE